MQCPDRITDVDSVAEGKRESSTLRDGGADGGFQEIHGRGVADVADRGVVWGVRGSRVGAANGQGVDVRPGFRIRSLARESD